MGKWARKLEVRAYKMNLLCSKALSRGQTEKWRILSVFLTVCMCVWESEEWAWKERLCVYLFTLPPRSHGLFDHHSFFCLTFSLPLLNSYSCLTQRNSLPNDCLKNHCNMHALILRDYAPIPNAFCKHVNYQREIVSKMERHINWTSCRGLSKLLHCPFCKDRMHSEAACCYLMSGEIHCTLSSSNGAEWVCVCVMGFPVRQSISELPCNEISVYEYINTSQ